MVVYGEYHSWEEDNYPDQANSARNIHPDTDPAAVAAASGSIYRFLYRSLLLLLSLFDHIHRNQSHHHTAQDKSHNRSSCLLYTSDAADD